MGHSCSSDSIPGLGTSKAVGTAKKGKKKVCSWRKIAINMIVIIFNEQRATKTMKNTKTPNKYTIFQKGNKTG